MSRRKRIVLIVASSFFSLLLLTVIAGILIVQSQWFYNKVRDRIITTAETATGGKVEIGSFSFNWKKLRADVTDFTLHGTEPAGKAPLLHAASVTVGLKIISLFARDIKLQYLEVVEPHIDLIVEPGGRTNIPAPKIKSTKKGLDPIQTILKVAVGHFALSKGVFEIEAKGSSPFDLQGQDLAVNLTYDPAVPRYHGDVSVQPLRAAFTGVTPFLMAFNASVTLQDGRIGVDSAKMVFGDSTVTATGALENLEALHGRFHYSANTTSAEITRLFHLKLLDRGNFQSTGDAVWAGGNELTINGNFHAYGLEFHDATIRLAGFRADGALFTDTKFVRLSAVRLSGNLSQKATPSVLQVDAHIATANLRGDELNLTGLAVSTLGGSFDGAAQLTRFDRFHVTGDFAGFDIKRAVAIYSATPLPWDGLMSGKATIDGSFKNSEELALSAAATIDPAPTGAPVRGQLAINFDAHKNILDLGNSTISLPSSRADFSGSLGHQLKVHAETRDLNDILPALGEDSKTFPVKLQNGQVIFDGSVTGNLDKPQIVGHVSATNAAYNGQALDSLIADVEASPDGVRIANGVATRAAITAQLQGSIALREWKANDAGAISGSASIQNVTLADVAALAKVKDLPVSGAISATAKVSGTLGAPVITADLSAAKGMIYSEPFDRVTAHVTYSGLKAEATGVQLDAGPRQIKLTASFEHQPGHFDTGKLTFQLSSNTMQLEQIQALAKDRPGVKGTLQLTANGAVNLAPLVNGSAAYRIEDLHAKVAALGLALNGQPFGDAHLTADSQNGSLHTQLDSNFAGSTIQGNGLWQLAGDYAGNSTITFAKLDFTQLHDWLAPSAPGLPSGFTGFAEGEIRIDGSPLKLQSLKATLKIPKFELDSAPVAGVSASSLKLTNAGDIVASLANGTVTVDSARFKGRVTDLSVTGKVQLQPKITTDVHVLGKVDLAVVHEFDRDLNASGILSADAAVRGDFSSPQITGRVQFEKAAFNISEVPNGLSNASGVILFSGSRATIQSFTGETGGGKVDLSGFATYADNDALFRLHAVATDVRVRLQGVSAVAGASLNFTGTTERSMLAGSVTVLRTSFNTDSDFSSLIAKSAEPVRTPAARTGLLGGMNFDVQIDTSPDLQVQSSLTQDVQLDANLHLRGTASNPALLGRVNVTQGDVVFFGTKYKITGGSIAFFNPVKIAPVIDVDLVTKARGVDITLTVSGPIDKLTLTPRSDPPLQFSEIVALLATGRAPTSDPALLTQQGGDAPSFAQMGASALLGQAIASPVTGRLQRFFGVSKLRIDPTLPGIDSNPQARLTLEQQVTPNITFTYITNVTTTNPQVVQVEWAFSKTWSVVALREENGMTGMDFFFKKRF